MIDLVRVLSDLDQAVDLHLARILILLDTFADESSDSIVGLTKLAKLDFLLRYPVLLERALVAKKHSVKGLQIQDHERMSVESKMVRYRFGPWDHRYRLFLNLLSAKGLAKVTVEGKTVVIAATKLGRELAHTMVSDELFVPYRDRAEILKRHFDLTASHLVKFIYDTFPEVITLRSNEVI